MQKVTPFLWFNDNAEEAAKFYVSVFKKAKIVDIGRKGPGKKAPVMSATVRIDGQEFVLFNGGPAYKFSPATSLYVDCKNQKEADRIWERLAKEGKPMRCGWIDDKYGVTWQIIPSGLRELIQDPRAMEAMMGMVKIDIQALRDAVKPPKAEKKAKKAAKKERKKGKKKTKAASEAE